VLLQTLPQPPQLFVEVDVLVSQPFVISPSQLPKPELQVIAQLPPLQLGVPLLFEHALEQVPQCRASFPKLTSHPVEAAPSQSAKPLLQEMWQALLTHDGIPPTELHAAPHPPQCATVAVVFVSHPFTMLPSQLPSPALHVIPHLPAEHDGVPVVDSQTLPHAPQFNVSARTECSQPLSELLSQSPNPALQLIAHSPLEHDGVPFAVPHVLLHTPQCCVFTSAFTSQPFAGAESQSLYEPEQPVT